MDNTRPNELPGSEVQTLAAIIDEEQKNEWNHKERISAPQGLSDLMF